MDHDLATGAGVEVSAFRFEDSPVHVGEVDLRPAFLHLARGEFLKLYLGLAKHIERAALVIVAAAADHPENARAMKEATLPAPFVFCPQLESSRSGFSVGLIGAVGAAHDASLAARGSARVARAPGVEQRDAGSAFQKMQGGPAAEGSGSDDGNLRLGFHCESFCRMRVENTGDGSAGEERLQIRG